MVGVGGSSPLGCTNSKGLQANSLKTVTYPHPIRNLIRLPKNYKSITYEGLRFSGIVCIIKLCLFSNLFE
jgi:hypothetical protein